MYSESRPYEGRNPPSARAKAAAPAYRRRGAEVHRLPKVYQSATPNSEQPM